MSDQVAKKYLTRRTVALNAEYHATLTLASRGLSTSAIAKELQVNPRTIVRRLAELVRRSCLSTEGPSTRRRLRLTERGAAVLAMGLAGAPKPTRNPFIESPIFDSILFAFFAAASGPLTSAELSEMLGISNRRAVDAISRMKHHGLIRSIGPERGKQWTPGRKPDRIVLGRYAIDRMIGLRDIDAEEWSARAVSARTPASEQRAA